MKTLKHNTRVRLPAWNHTSSAQFGTVRGYAVEKGADPKAEWDRALFNGHDLAWAIQGGACIDNTGHSYRQALAEAKDAVTLEDGEVIAVEGEPETYRVKVMKGNEAGPRNSDPIHFLMIPDLTGAIPVSAEDAFEKFADGMTELEQSDH